MRSLTENSCFESLVLFLIIFILLPFIHCGTFPLFISLIKLNCLLVEIISFPIDLVIPQDVGCNKTFNTIFYSCMFDGLSLVLSKSFSQQLWSIVRL